MDSQAETAYSFIAGYDLDSRTKLKPKTANDRSLIFHVQTKISTIQWSQPHWLLVEPQSPGKSMLRAYPTEPRIITLP